MKNNHFFLLALFVLTAFFAQAQSYTRTVTVLFDSAPSSYSIDVAKLKYNKDFAYSLTIDDGYIDVWNVAFPLIQGNSVVEADVYQGHNYGSGAPFQKIGGYTFSDGCGNEIPFHLGLAINASQVGQYANRLKWWQLNTMFDAGWDILNHGHLHDELPPIDFYDEIVQNAVDINNSIGFYPRHFAIPANQPAYASETKNHGMVATYGNVAGFKGMYSDGFWNVNGDISDINNHLELLRTSVPIEGAPMNLQTLKTKIQSIANMVTNQTIWYNEYTHAVGAGSNQYPNISNLGFDLLKDYLGFLQNDYGQKIWVAGLQEVEEYLFVRENAAITNQSLVGNVLTFDVTLSASQPDQRHFELSLLVDGLGASVLNIDVLGNEYATSNPATGLVNFQLVPVQCHDYVISGNIHFDEYSMPGPYKTITVESGAVFNITPGKELSFCENGQLIIKPGGSVNFLGTLTANTHWKGIRIEKNTSQIGIFRSYQGALIENADQGLFMNSNEGISLEEIPIICERTTFKNCHQGVNISFNQASFYQCSFINSDNFMHPSGFSAFAKLASISVPGVLFSRCKFVDARVGVILSNNGIIAENAVFIVE